MEATPRSADDEVVGRDHDLSAIDAFLLNARQAPANLVLAGPAGIGKTVLWRAAIAVAGAAGMRVLSARPTEVEATLDHVGLADLFGGVKEEVVRRLPGAQAAAIRVALRRAEPAAIAPDPLSIGLATLGLLRELAGSRPVLVAIDDVQWLDPGSSRALEFAFRRGDGRRVSLLATERASDASRPSAGRRIAGGTVETRAVGPLGIDGLEALLRLHLGVGFLRPTLVRIEAASGGNPFYALEIGRGLLRRGIRFAPEVLPIPDSLSEIVSERLAALSPDASAVALVAAVLAMPTADKLRGAAASIGASDGLAAAVQAGVLEEAAGVVRFTHPLLSSVAYDTATPERRRAAHRAAARVVDDPEERARHLGLAAERPNERTARIVEAAAGRSRARGSSESAAMLTQLAYQLTPAARSVHARRRAIGAAEHFIRSGDPDRAIALLEGVSTPPGAARAEVLVALADAHSSGDWEERYRLLEAAAAEAGDSPARVVAERLLAGAGMVMDRDLPEAVAHGRLSVRLAERLGDPTQLALSLAVLCRVRAWQDGTIDRAALDRAVALAAGLEFVHVIARPEFAVAQLVPGHEGDLLEQIRQVEALRAEAVRIGDWDAAVHLTSFNADLLLRAGGWSRALTLATEAEQLSHLVGQPGMRAVVLNAYASVLAHLGRTVEAETALDEAEVQGRIVRGTGNARVSAMVRGFLALSLGDPAAAHVAMGRAVTHQVRHGSQDPERLRELADEIEALCLLGRVDDAEAVLEPYERRSRVVGSPNIRALAERCRALILAGRGDLATALAGLRGVAAGAFEDEPFERARTLLQLGEVARRERKIGEARRSLAAAAEQFERLGATTWAANARREEGRLAGRHPGSGLTETELEIAHLVASGRTNREVADALFMSRHTVDSHLRRIFDAFDVHSRTELAGRFAAAGAGAPRVDAGR